MKQVIPKGTSSGHVHMKKQKNTPDREVNFKVFLFFFFSFFTKKQYKILCQLISFALHELQSFTWYSKVLILNQKYFCI